MFFLSACLRSLRRCDAAATVTAATVATATAVATRGGGGGGGGNGDGDVDSGRRSIFSSNCRGTVTAAGAVAAAADWLISTPFVVG